MEKSDQEQSERDGEKSGKQKEGSDGKVGRERMRRVAKSREMLTYRIFTKMPLGQPDPI